VFQSTNTSSADRNFKPRGLPQLARIFARIQSGGPAQAVCQHARYRGAGDHLPLEQRPVSDPPLEFCLKLPRNSGRPTKHVRATMRSCSGGQAPMGAGLTSLR
jgi:hypothetical protein